MFQTERITFDQAWWNVEEARPEALRKGRSVAGAVEGNGA